MRSSTCRLLWLSLLALAASTSACGAGLITGISANQGGNRAEASPPELSLSPALPLVPAPNTTRSVVVTNAQIPASAPLRVTLEALGLTVDQLSPVASGQGGLTAISFTLDTTAIVAAVGDPTSGDVAASLSVLVDDEPIAAAVAVVLVRQPAAQLELAVGQQQLFMSPFGEAVTLRVGGLSSIDANNMQMLVETRDPDPASGLPSVLTRVCTGLSATATGSPGEALVRANVPGNSFPDRARLFLRDSQSGESTQADVFYRPDITLALPSQGVTTGGNLVTLIGTALVPHDFGQTPAPLAFDAVELSFAKGGRSTALPREDFREELSAGDRLVFRMPVSPDGRPGQVDIVLRVQLDGVQAEVTASQEFLFANPNPFFGPRGAVLDEQPVTVVPIALDVAPAGNDVADFAVLTEEGGTGFVQLLLAQRNGMFQRFGAPRQIGDHEVAAERGPRDLCAADFDGDLVPDLLLINAGAATAVHHLILGQARPLTPLGVVHRIAGAPGMVSCRVALVDGDALADVILVPGPGAPAGALPQVLLSRPNGVGAPAFAAPINITVRAFDYQAVVINDIDGDGNVDFGVVDGNQLKLDVAFGNGDGTFGPAFELDFTVPTYTADPDSTAIGLHTCGNGQLQSLALVLSGDDDGSGVDPDPVVATLHQSVGRTFAVPMPADVQGLGTDPIGVSLVDDVYPTGSPEFELVIAVRGDPSPGSFASMGVFRFDGSSFSPIGIGVLIGGGLPRSFRALHYGRAFPTAQTTWQGSAIFAVHESEVDGVRERQLSTLLVYDDGLNAPVLLPPDAGEVRGNPVLSVIGGNWSPIAVSEQGRVRDLALARTDSVDIVPNDGYGGVPLLGESLSAPGLLPRTLQLVPGASQTVERIAFLDAASRLTTWRPDIGGSADEVNMSGELRLLSSSPTLQSATLDEASQLRSADVDGDGILDLVVLLRFAPPNQGADEGLLALCRGKANPLPNELPFYEPTVVTPVSGLATSLALGDFAAVATGPQQLEMALAVPAATSAGGLDGDHLRFFRYVAGASPAADRFVASAESGGPQVLLAGSRPTRVVAGDFDRDGLIDLLVAADGDDTLRLFRNVALPTIAIGEVEVGSFLEALSSPRALSPGTPTDLRLGDVNGDGAVDAITVVATVGTTTHDSTAVAFYLSEEPGVFGDAEFVSPTRLGDRIGMMALDLGDWNRDGVLDLFLGWNTAGTGDQNLRVLFGGSR